MWTLENCVNKHIILKSNQHRDNQNKDIFLDTMHFEKYWPQFKNLHESFNMCDKFKKKIYFGSQAWVNWAHGMHFQIVSTLISQKMQKNRWEEFPRMLIEPRAMFVAE